MTVALPAVKPLPAKGYCVAKFLVSESVYWRGCRYLALADRRPHRQFVHGLVTPGGTVTFTNWLFRHTSYEEHHELIRLLALSDHVGPVSVRMEPRAFPAQYGLGRFARR